MNLPGPDWPIEPSDSARARGRNAWAFTGLLFSVTSLVLNPFAIVGLIGIVFSALGLARSHQLEGMAFRVTGRGQAVAGLVVGLVETVYFAYRLGEYLG
jgi:hypothetical protein